MPRHGGSGMPGHATRQKGGTKRRTRGPKNTYDSVFRRVDWRVQPVVTAPRGPAAPLQLVEAARTNSTSTKPQAPKPPKGGSKPVGTPRGKPSQKPAGK